MVGCAQRFNYECVLPGYLKWMCHLGCIRFQMTENTVQTGFGNKEKLLIHILKGSEIVGVLTLALFGLSFIHQCSWLCPAPCADFVLNLA